MAVALPVMLMVIFVYLFGGALNTGTPYVNYVVPGVIAGLRRLRRRHHGGQRGAPTSPADHRPVPLDGRARRGADPGAGRRERGCATCSRPRSSSGSRSRSASAPHVGAAALARRGRACSTLFVLALSWLAAAIGILARNPEAASGMTFLISFLPYPSSAFVPIHTMPSWLRGFAQHQPVTPVVDALRALLLGGPVGDAAWQALVWSAGITWSAALLAGVLFRRRTA